MPLAIRNAFSLRPGEHYAGILLGDQGQPTAHLLLMSGEQEAVTWEQAQAWADEIGAELPTRQELVLLYANLKGQFRAGWYWSCERNGADTDYVCGQDFGYGSQGACHKANTARARAVRRLPI